MILHINTADTWRGGEQQLLYLVKGLQKQKKKQIVIGQPNSELQKKITGIAEFIPVKMRGEVDPFCIRKIRKIIHDHKVKIIHAHTAKAHSIALRACHKYHHIRLLVSRRVDFPIKKNFLSKRKYFTPKVDYFLCVSDNVKSILIEDGVDPYKILTVRSGVDLSRFHKKVDINSLYQEFPFAQESVVIGNIAALVDHKDQKTLLHSIAKIQTKHPFKLLIIGEGELRQELIALCKQLQLEDKVIFTGFRKDILELLQFINIFTLTSKEEGLGTSVLDAMAAGLPCVVTRGGGIGEMIVHDRGGFIADVGDCNGLAKSFTRLIENQQIREEQGKFNLQHVKKFSVEETVKKTIAIYDSLYT